MYHLLRLCPGPLLNHHPCRTYRPTVSYFSQYSTCHLVLILVLLTTEPLVQENNTFLSKVGRRQWDQQTHTTVNTITQSRSGTDTNLLYSQKKPKRTFWEVLQKNFKAEKPLNQPPGFWQGIRAIIFTSCAFSCVHQEG